MEVETVRTSLDRKIIPPISTPVIDEKVNPEKLRFNIEKMNRSKVGGYLALGSNGESVLMNRQERLVVIETTRTFMSPEKLLVAGTGMESTRETIALTKQAAALGADFALVGNPHYFKSAMKTDVLHDHYVAVAENSTIPIIVYNSPAFTGINLEPGLIAKLSRHPNICGVKDGTGNIDQLAEYIRLGVPDFMTITGNAPTFLAALFTGISSGMMPITNVYPDAWVRILTCFHENDLAGARRLDAVLAPMVKVVMKYGPGGIKAAIELTGYYGGPPLRPLKPPSQEGLAEIQEALRRVEDQFKQDDFEGDFEC